MSIRPIDVVMSITQAQNLTLHDPNNVIKHAQQHQIIEDKNIKANESVAAISDDGNDTESMSELKNGMSNQQNSAFNQQKDSHHEEENHHHKALLDEDNGNVIDILS